MRGRPGPPGRPGSEGPPRRHGPIGPIGLNGVNGNMGIQGDIGPAGPSDAPGEKDAKCEPSRASPSWHLLCFSLLLKLQSMSNSHLLVLKWRDARVALARTEIF